MHRQLISTSVRVICFAALTIAAGVSAQSGGRRAAGNPDAVICLSASVFLGKGKFACLQVPNCADATAGEFAEALPAQAMPAATCYSRDPASQRFRPTAGSYLIWRNVTHDLWVRLDVPGADPNAVLAALKHVGPLLKARYPKLNYTGIQITPAPVAFDGVATLERGFALGGAEGRQSADAKAFIEGAQATAEQLAQAEKTAATCAQAPASPQCAQGLAQMEAVAQTQRSNLVAEAKAASEAGGTEGTSPGTEASAQKPPSQGSDGEGEPGGTSDVEGSGGILPAGAPPWIADLLDMILMYFGVSDVVKGAGLALFLLAPDVVNSLASISAALTKGLNNAELNKGFAAIKELYQFYNTLSSAMKNLQALADKESFSSIGAMLMETGKVIQALPPTLQSELTDQVGKQVQDLAQKAAAATGAVDPEVLAALVSGNADAAFQALGEEAARQAEAELRRHARRLIEQELGIDLSQFAGVAQALVDSDQDAAITAAESYLGREVADRLGVDAALLAAVRVPGAALDQLRSLAAERVAAKLARVVGMNVLSEGQIRDLMRDPGKLDGMLQTVAADQRERVRTLIDSVVKGQIPRELAEQGKAYLQARLPADLRDLDLSRPPEALAGEYLEKRHGKDIDRLARELSSAKDLARFAADFPGTVKRLRENPRLQPAELKKQLIAEAERRVRQALTAAIGEPLQYKLDSLQVSSSIQMQIRAHLVNPDPAKLASVIWHDARRRIEGPALEAQKLANRVRSCVDMPPFAATGVTLDQARSDLTTSLAAIDASLLPLAGKPVAAWVEATVSAHCPADAKPQQCAQETCSAVRDAIAKHVAELDSYVVQSTNVRLRDAATVLATMDATAFAPPAFMPLKQALATGDTSALASQVGLGLLGIPSQAESRAGWLRDRLTAIGVPPEEAAAAVSACLGKEAATCLQTVSVTRQGVAVTSWESLLSGLVEAEWSAVDRRRKQLFSDFRSTCHADDDIDAPVVAPTFSKEAAIGVLLGTTPASVVTLASQLACCNDRCTAQVLDKEVAKIADAATLQLDANVGALQAIVAQGRGAASARFDAAMRKTASKIAAVDASGGAPVIASSIGEAIDGALTKAAKVAPEAADTVVQSSAVASLLKLEHLQQLSTCVKKARLECAASDANWKIPPCADELASCRSITQQRPGAGP